MKRFVLLALVAAFVLGTFGMASAETKVTFTGEHINSFQWARSVTGANGVPFQKDAGEDAFRAVQRDRLYMNFAASENVSATLGLEIGDMTWGRTGTGGRANGDEMVVEVKRAKMDFTVPNTALKVSMGLQGVGLPTAISAANPVFNGDYTSIVASYAFNDMFSATALWARAVDTNATDGASWSANDETDGVGVILSIAPVQGLSMKPYFLYGTIGKNAGTTAIAKDEDATWFGMSTALTMFDPIAVLWDFNYGSKDGATASRDADGWTTDLAVAYKMDFMTPTLVFHYGTGEGSNAGDGSEQMPTLAHDTNYAITNLGTDNNIGRTTGGLLTNLAATHTDGGAGVMAFGLILDKISFVENLTNTFKVVYYKGTNDKALGAVAATNAYFTEKDSAWELNLDTTYQLYENLSAIVELGYVNVDWDENTARGSNFLDQDAYKLGVSLRYNF